MTEPSSPDLRIGDPERDEALRVLGEHMSLGRLTVDEYGDRSARASAARTRGELTQLFADLPQPHPRLDQLQPMWGRAPGPAAPPDRRRTPVGQRLFPLLVPLSGLLAVVLFVAVPGMTWLVFLLPAVVTLVAGALRNRG